ncbi:hypothetical protein GBA52_024960 [Prunus armeniaca]|nr:hypothetical protein GBA52_024960 [Prunus armeniaca]
MTTSSRGGFSYFITFIDDHSWLGYVYLMKHKFESFEKFKEFKNEVEKQTRKSIKILRSDRGEGFWGIEWHYCVELDMRHAQLRVVTKEQRSRNYFQATNRCRRVPVGRATFLSSSSTNPPKTLSDLLTVRFVGYPKEPLDTTSINLTNKRCLSPVTQASRRSSRVIQRPQTYGLLHDIVGELHLLGDNEEKDDPFNYTKAMSDIDSKK